ncbi:hypothetical protein [Lysinibacillus xylanilyticus]|uniref:hypothetical protein n=1 Tax=Lysinibacillus xylanilyticus TaxID=582475 RepID=UPI00380116BA
MSLALHGRSLVKKKTKKVAELTDATEAKLIFDEEKNTGYWALENGERIHPNYDANAIIDWLNNVKF